MRSELSKQILSFLIFTVISVTVIFLLSGFVNITAPEIENNTLSTESTEDTESQTDNEESQNSENDPESTPEVTPEENTYILSETKDGKNEYLEKIVFLGDKVTYSMGRYSYTGIPDPIRQVWSVEQNVCATQVMSVSNFIYPHTQEATNYLSAIRDRAPAYLILSFGSYDNEEELTKDIFISSIGNLIINIKSASPNTQVMVQSILPVSEDCTVLTPFEVSERNEWLKETCQIFKVYYLDTYSSLCDENGVLLEEFSSGDGYLLNEDGYRNVVDYVKTHVHPNYTENNE